MKRFVINIDDVGSTHGANEAYLKLAPAGAVTSGSVMCVCPYYPEFIQRYREAREQSDQSAASTLPIGLHVTLTSEWETYRWRPLTGSFNSLCGEGGYFHANNEAFLEHAQKEDIKSEIRAQLERALEDGLALTHMDAHMGTAFLPNALDAFLELADEYEVSPLLVKNRENFISLFYPDGTEAQRVDQALSERSVIFDDFVMVQRHYPEQFYLNPAEHYYQTYEALADGTYFVATHADTCSELHHIAPRWVHVRRNEYEMLGSKDFANRLSQLGIALITWKEAKGER